MRPKRGCQIFDQGPSVKARLRFKIADQTESEVELLSATRLEKAVDGVLTPGKADRQLRPGQHGRPAQIKDDENSDDRR